MFHVKNHKQLHIFDPLARIVAKRREILGKSWSGLFRKEILQELPVDSLANIITTQKVDQAKNLLHVRPDDFPTNA